MGQVAVIIMILLFFVGCVGSVKNISTEGVIPVQTQSSAYGSGVHLSVSVPIQDFPQTVVGSDSATLSVMILNLGGTDSQICSDATVTDSADPANFTIAETLGDNCTGILIEKGSYCTINVIATPRTIGTHRATLSISCGDKSASTILMVTGITSSSSSDPSDSSSSPFSGSSWDIVDINNSSLNGTTSGILTPILAGSNLGSSVTPDSELNGTIFAYNSSNCADTPIGSTTILTSDQEREVIINNISYGPYTSGTKKFYLKLLDHDGNWSSCYDIQKKYKIASYNLNLQRTTSYDPIILTKIDLTSDGNHLIAIGYDPDDVNTPGRIIHMNPSNFSGAGISTLSYYPSSFKIDSTVTPTKIYVAGNDGLYSYYIPTMGPFDAPVAITTDINSTYNSDLVLKESFVYVTRPYDDTNCLITHDQNLNNVTTRKSCKGAESLYLPSNNNGVLYIAYAIASPLSSAIDRAILNNDGTIQVDNTITMPHSSGIKIVGDPIYDYIYIINPQDNSITTYNTLLTTTNPPIYGNTARPYLSSPTDLCFASDGIHLYVASKTSNELVVLSRDPSNGSLHYVKSYSSAESSLGSSLDGISGLKCFQNKIYVIGNNGISLIEYIP